MTIITKPGGGGAVVNERRNTVENDYIRRGDITELFQQNIDRLYSGEQKIEYLDGFTPVASNSTAHDTFCICRSIVENAPAADVRPVVRGRWIEKKEGTFCSECNKNPANEWEYYIGNYHKPYCPNCGVTMED